MIWGAPAYPRTATSGSKPRSLSGRRGWPQRGSPPRTCNTAWQKPRARSPAYLTMQRAAGSCRVAVTASPNSAWTGIIDGAVQSFRFDRAFEDGGERWVVDFKTGPVGGAGAVPARVDRPAPAATAALPHPGGGTLPATDTNRALPDGATPFY